MIKLPRSRRNEIVVQEMDNEVLIYDLSINKAFALNETAAAIFQACDGNTSFADLKNTTKFTDEIIFLTLDELKKESLLDDDSYVSPFAGMKRREVIKKIGLTTMFALPIVASLVAPTALMASSVCVNIGGLAPGMNASNCTTNPGGCDIPCASASVTVRCCSNMTIVGTCSPSPFPGQVTCPCTCVA